MNNSQRSGFGAPKPSAASAPQGSPLAQIPKVLLLLMLCATTVAGFLWLPAAEGFRNPALARIVVFHVPCSIVASIASGVTMWYAIAYLATRRPMHDVKSRVSAELSLLFWILTTVTGAIFAKAQWGTYWNWDIKQGAIILLLMIYAAYFALRSAITDERKQAVIGAAYGIFATLCVPFLTYILPNSTPDTLHPKGTITTKDGLSPEYKLVLWVGVLGLTLVYVWVWRQHVALDAIRSRLAARRTPPPASGFVIVETGQ
ncbi:hypothetical protein CCAX7_43430 [Capsulimonas corticalis]|uniref:Heme exporter protein C n=1 Tax=Capsulimonas corticalis TaxID=2219043 RepID=A0A402CXJ1_9BACT|nr:cytochrome c biogenesis protein CcsA [Capsulimonas corticalis]BDI32292.1 hypothetical protein CCAX7_43430 [Capsulimonas corticalis]